MRFGISATSLMCPKNLRTRLRPVNVCCAIVASHFVARSGRAVQDAAAAAPRVEFFEPVLGTENPVSGRHVLNLFFRPSKRKTTRGAHRHARPSQRLSSRTAKARNSLLSQRLTGKSGIPAHRAFVLSTRYGATIVQIRGVNPPIPTLFRVRPASGRSVARLLHPARPRKGGPRSRASLDARPGSRASKLALT